MKFLLSLAVCLGMAFSVFAGNPAISVDYDKMTIRVDEEVISLNEEQQKAYKGWKKDLDENGPTEDIARICPHLEDLIAFGNDAGLMLKFTREHPHELMIVKYNLKLQNEARIKAAEEAKSKE